MIKRFEETTADCISFLRTLPQIVRELRPVKPDLTFHMWFALYGASFVTVNIIASVINKVVSADYGWSSPSFMIFINILLVALNFGNYLSAFTSYDSSRKIWASVLIRNQVVIESPIAGFVADISQQEVRNFINWLNENVDPTAWSVQIKTAGYGLVSLSHYVSSDSDDPIYISGDTFKLVFDFKNNTDAVMFKLMFGGK